MKFITGVKDLNLNTPMAITLGKFDGLHKGHQKLFRKVIDLKEEGCQSCVFTFAVPPSLLLTGENLQRINTNTERKNFLERFGIDCMIEASFQELWGMNPEEFVREILVKRLKAAYIVVGEDFHFGYQRSGDVKLLSQLENELGYQLLTFKKERYGTKDISSSYVRAELAKGNMELANYLLGYDYTILGEVLHGNKIGRTLGLPTINLVPPKDKLLPPNGVYISRTRIEDKYYQGITNIGRKPTIEGESPIGVETHLFGCQKDLYGKEAEVMLLHYKRPEMKFASLEELGRQMSEDVEFGKNYKWNNQ